jgi:protein-S-isoprenylcysteine O-methyltransferase Ste14
MTPAPEPLPRLLRFPPLLYSAAFILGLGLHQLMPVQALPPVVARAAGLLFAVVSVGLLLWARQTLRQAGTTSLPGRTSVALTFRGPYTMTRHPMCLGVAGIHLSLGLLLNALAPLVLFLPVFVLVEQRVIRWEERALAARFGAPYLDYLARVPRWF